MIPLYRDIEKNSHEKNENIKRYSGTFYEIFLSLLFP
jgi:hypothetical protein